MANALERRLLITQFVDLGSIPSRVRRETLQLVCTVSLLDVQLEKRRSVKPTLCVRQMGW